VATGPSSSTIPINTIDFFIPEFFLLNAVDTL
jgi:hypothetical protein